MGLLRAEIVELAKILSSINSPAVLMLGKQDIVAELNDIKSLMEKYDISFSYEERDDKMLDAYELFYALGAKEVRALDISSYEGADVLFDLNSADGVPNELYEHFDLVIDGGVLEHIFRPDRALKNIADMLKMDGYVYHMVPCAGMINHGFYSFSPLFFIDYYKKPYWKLLSIRMQYKPQRGMYKFVFYSMDCRLFLCQDGFNKYVSDYWGQGGEIMIQCICQKQNDGANDDALLQGMYQKIAESR